jgi:hypothetical protein
MRHLDIAGSPTDVATLFMDIVRNKDAEQFVDWIAQLAVDVLEVTPAPAKNRRLAGPFRS